jgi:hypothetical protein
MITHPITPEIRAAVRTLLDSERSKWWTTNAAA